MNLCCIYRNLNILHEATEEPDAVSQHIGIEVDATNDAIDPTSTTSSTSSTKITTTTKHLLILPENMKPQSMIETPGISNTASARRRSSKKAEKQNTSKENSVEEDQHSAVARKPPSFSLFDWNKVTAVESHHQPPPGIRNQGETTQRGLTKHMIYTGELNNRIH